MEERPVTGENPGVEYDIFLCTRELPDALTAETAALRQLCSALAGSGFRVFFPSALPADLTDEQRAEKIVEALRSAKVMVAAGVGSENAADPVSAKLREAFLARAEADPSRQFVVCWRDAAPEALPDDLAGREILDMSDLGFLVTLKSRLSEWLAPPPEDASPAEAPASEPESVKKPFPWKWLLLAAVVTAVVLLFVLKRCA